MEENNLPKLVTTPRGPQKEEFFFAKTVERKRQIKERARIRGATADYSVLPPPNKRVATIVKMSEGGGEKEAGDEEIRYIKNKQGWESDQTRYD